jgi:hypothetical protein
MSGVVGYLYQSAKDSIKWHRQKPKELINLIMDIGRLVYLPDEEFEKISIESDVKIEELDARTLNNLAIAMQNTKEK